MNPTIALDFPEVIVVKPGYEKFFNKLINIVNSNTIDNTMGEKLRTHVFDFLKDCNLNDFNVFSDTLYTRIHLGKDEETGWEAIMMCWKKGNKTSVHGHPEFAAYNFAKGDFIVEVFTEDADGVTLLDAFEAKAGQGFFAIGEKDSFNNHIHRITCMSDYGFSLHVYSDDARKGKTYNHSLNN
jgi:predicted metal-dependent enzyme (double-stranded beta helix superfamily)